MRTTGKRLERLEQRTDAGEVCRLIIYTDDADREQQVAEARAAGIEPGRIVCIPDNGRARQGVHRENEG